MFARLKTWKGGLEKKEKTKNWKKKEKKKEVLRFAFNWAELFLLTHYQKLLKISMVIQEACSFVVSFPPSSWTPSSFSTISSTLSLNLDQPFRIIVQHFSLKSKLGSCLILPFIWLVTYPKIGQLHLNYHCQSRGNV